MKPFQSPSEARYRAYSEEIRNAQIELAKAAGPEQRALYARMIENLTRKRKIHNR